MSANTGPNMTPMVDIVMCLLIFCMLTMDITGSHTVLESKLAAEKGPGIVDKPDLKAPAVTSRIEIRSDPQTHQPVVLAFGQVIRNLDRDLPEILVQKQADMSADVQIVIQPHSDVHYQDVITVYDQCIKAQFKNVAFMMPLP